MRANKHDFVAQCGIDARYLGEDVVTIEIVLIKARADFDAKLDRHSGLDQPDEHVVMLGGEHDVGTASDVVVAIALNAHGAVFHRSWREGDACSKPRGDVSESVAPAWRWKDPEAADFRFAPDQLPSDGCIRSARRNSVCGRSSVQLRPAGVGPSRSMSAAATVADIDGRPGQNTRRRRRPGLRITDQRHVTRRDHLDGEFLQRPAMAKLERFQARIRESPLPQVFDRPARGFKMRRGSREPRTEHVGQAMENHGGFGAAHSFGLDRIDRRLLVTLFLSR